VFLVIGNLSSTIITTLVIFVIARILGPALYGVYSLSLVPVAVFILLTSWGINTSVIRFSAYHNSRNEIEIARRKNRHAIEFLIILGTVFTVISYLTAPYVAAGLLHRPDITPFIRLASFSILGQVLLTGSISTFVGWGIPKYAGLANILQAVIKAIGAVVFLAMGLGVFGALLAHVVSFIIAGWLGIVFVYFLKVRSKPEFTENQQSKTSFFQDVRALIVFGFPSEAAGNVSGFISGTFLTIVLAGIASDVVIGWFQAATNITVAIALVSNSITSALLPGFSGLFGKSGDTNLAFKYAVRYTSFLIIPIILFIAGSSSVLITLIYGKSYSPAAPYLLLLAIGFTPIAIGLATYTPFFAGVGKTNFPLFTNLSSLPPVLILAPLLGEIIGPYGLIYAVIISDIITCIVGLYLASHYLHATIDYKSSLSILLTAVICFAVIYVLPVLRIPSVPLLILDVVIFTMLYLTLSPLLHNIDHEDVLRLKSATMELGIVSKIIEIVLDYEDWIIRRL
jgi:O-antigen/teichoic acid export membrane protein